MSNEAILSELYPLRYLRYLVGGAKGTFTLRIYWQVHCCLKLSSEITDALHEEALVEFIRGTATVVITAERHNKRYVPPRQTEGAVSCDLGGAMFLQTADRFVFLCNIFSRRGFRIILSGIRGKMVLLTLNKNSESSHFSHS